MSQLLVRFDTSLDQDTRLELGKALNFYYEGVEVGTASNGGFIVSAPASVLDEDQLRSVVRHFLRGHRPAEPVVAAEHPGRATGNSLPFADDRTPVAPGAYLHGPEWTAATEAVRGIVRERLSCEFPAPALTGSAFMPRDVLIRAGYYRNFPNLVNGVSRIRPDYWDGVSVAGLRPSQVDALASFYEPSDLVLNPVTCYQVYANAVELVPRYGSTLFSIEGPVYRHESHNHGPTRLAEFRMYELVRLGSVAEVREEFDRFLAAFEKFFAGLGLPFRIVTASDSFFGDDPSITRRTQLGNAAKYEVRVPAGDEEVSVGSVNLHGGVFAEAFGLHSVGGVEASCCAGIGIDRLVHILGMHNLLPVGGPESVTRSSSW